MTLSRRDFLKGAATAGAAAVAGVDISAYRSIPPSGVPAGEFIPAGAPVAIRNGLAYVWKPYGMSLTVQREDRSFREYDAAFQWASKIFAGDLEPSRIVRTDRRINRRLRRERGRAERGVRRYQGMRR